MIDAHAPETENTIRSSINNFFIYWYQLKEIGLYKYIDLELYPNKSMGKGGRAYTLSETKTTS